jgi:protein gp37
MAERLQSMGQPRYRNGFQLTLQPDVVNQPLSWNKPRLVFVNSMSDLFHDGVPISYLKAVFSVMEQASKHTFQILTKRSKRLANVAGSLRWPANVWIGVSVESEDYAYRIDDLRSVPAVVRFLSVEPLLGPIRKLSLRDIDWVIVGGESGPFARAADPDWVRDIRNQCVSARVPFFFKQWGGTRKAASGRLLDGRTWDELPARSAFE